MSLKDLQEDFSKIIKPQIEEILRLLRDLHTNNVTGNIEAAAAKVITELKTTIQECHCSKEVPQVPTEENSSSKPWKYSYPNFSVGNEDLGTGRNLGSLTWPFGADKEKSA